MPLNFRQQAFVDAYVGNGTAAARAAGYQGSDQTLAETASKLLKQPKVKQALEARRAAVEARAVDTASVGRIATRFERQAFWTKTMEDALEEMSTRLKASELLGKSEADFTEKHQHAGAMTVQVINPYASPKEK